MPERGESIAEREGPLGPTPVDASDEEAIRRRGILLVTGFVGLLGCVVILGIIASIVWRQQADAADTTATTFLHGLASPLLDAVMNAATVIGSDWVLVPVAVLAAVWLWRARHGREAIFIPTVLAGSVLVNAAMKVFFHRARPVLPWARVLPDYSFPSGHSMNSLALGLAIALVVWRLSGPRPGIVAVVIAVAASTVIGMSRIYLGVHFLTDVLGGFMSAILWVAVVVAAFRPGRLPVRPRAKSG